MPKPPPVEYFEGQYRMPVLVAGPILAQMTKIEGLELSAPKLVTEVNTFARNERTNHHIIDASRKTRIARGSGSTIAEVNQLIRQYEQMRKMMAQLNKGGLFGGLGKKMMGGLAGGLPGMGGLGGLLGGGGGMDLGNEDPGDSGSKRIKKKKRHKKRK